MVYSFRADTQRAKRESSRGPRRPVTALTRKCQYALRALYFLACEYGKGPILIPRISAHANAPAGFLQAILFELKHAGVLESRRGSHGGYYLRIPPNCVTVGSIIRIIDGPLVTLPCVAEKDGHPCADCHDPDTCQTRLLMRGVHEAVRAILDHTTLLPADNPVVSTGIADKKNLPFSQSPYSLST
jgi:Rrf2 family protein